MKNGFLRLTYDFSFSNGPKLLENNAPKFQINDAKYHEVDHPLIFSFFNNVRVIQKYCYNCLCLTGVSNLPYVKESYSTGGQDPC